LLTQADIEDWMSDGDPPTDESYTRQRYHYPRSAGQAVIRIPIPGPAPFNTLVIVRGYAYSSIGAWADDILKYGIVGIKTRFDLAGHDRDREPNPPFSHSTIAAQQMIQTNFSTSFVVAIDEVGGFFDEHGTWIVALRIASQWDEVIASSACYYSSWILCNEYHRPIP
jgi:hypothetical protein